METGRRLAGLRSVFESEKLDALLVTSRANVRYLTGFSGSAGTLVVTATRALLVTDGRYAEQAVAEIAAAEVEAEVATGESATRLGTIDGAVAGLRRVGLEADDVTWGTKRTMTDAFSSFSTGGGFFVPTRGLVERLRRVKDAGEIARIERAADIADVALAQVKEKLLERLTEAEFALELDYEMRRRGADAAAFSTIVASGANGSRPHAAPSTKRIEEGDVVVVDFGALVEGYHSDMTRTFSVGPLRSAELSDVLDAVLVSQRAGVRTTRAGVPARDVDAACRSSLESDGYGPLFVHGTGHGVGLEIHEAPDVRKGSADILEEGAVITVEPGAYLPGVGGVRIEDTLVVTATGARPLTKSTKDTTL